MNIISCEDYTPTSQSTTGIFVYSDSQIHVKTDISCLPVYTWHVHPATQTCLFSHVWHVWPATQDMFVQSCMTCSPSHTGHVCSVMYDMFDQPHRTCLFSHAWHVHPATQDMFVQSCMTCFSHAWHVSHTATQDMFVQSCMTCLTSHTWRVRSVMHDSTDGVQTDGVWPTRKEQKKMKETKYGMARSTPHSNLNRLEESLSHKRPLMHDNMICCQFSPVAHLHIRQSTDYRTQAIPPPAANWRKPLSSIHCFGFTSISIQRGVILSYQDDNDIE